jgi:hypothetical protein
MNIQVYDNFLTKEMYNYLESEITSSYFPWYFNSTVTYDYKDSDFNFQFTHTFHQNNEISSDWFYLLEPFIDKLKIDKILKAKANLLTRSDQIKIFDLHVDTDIESLNAKTAIYYINSNNGFTLFKDQTRIASVANRLLLFDKNYLHTGTTCTDQKSRCVININF